MHEAAFRETQVVNVLSVPLSPASARVVHDLRDRLG
jgi:hypothetical protein